MIHMAHPWESAHTPPRPEPYGSLFEKCQITPEPYGSTLGNLVIHFTVIMHTGMVFYCLFLLLLLILLLYIVYCYNCSLLLPFENINSDD